MALSAKRKAELATMDLPSDAEIRERAIRFRQVSGLTMAEFSEAVGYGSSSLGVYLHSNYGNKLTENHDASRNTLSIRAALKEYMDLWEHGVAKESGVSLHPTKDLRSIVEACLRAMEQGSACVIDGPPATQKTASLREVERIVKARNDGSRALYIYARSNHAPLGLLRTICNAAGIPNRGDIDQLILKLSFFLGRGRTLLMIDEANNLPNHTLDVIRQLLDLPPYFGIALGGSNDLTVRLSHWKMERFHSRVRKTLLVNGPSDAEAREILRARLGTIPDSVCEATIAKCRVKATRTQIVDGDPVTATFRYISARKLVWAIDHAREQINAGAAKQSRKESAA